MSKEHIMTRESSGYNQWKSNAYPAIGLVLAGQPMGSLPNQSTDPTAQPTSSPTQLPSNDPLSIGTNSTIAIALVSVLLFCCLLLGLVYKRSKSGNIAELSPHQKWKEAEEAKRAGMHRSAGSTSSSFQSTNTFSSKICAADRAPSISLSGIYGDDKTPKGNELSYGYRQKVNHKPSSGNSLQGNFDNSMGTRVDRMMSYDNQDIEVDGIQNYNGQWDEERGGTHGSFDSYGGNALDDLIHNPLASKDA